MLTEKISMSTQFDTLANQIGNEISNASVDGKPIVAAGLDMTTVNLDGTNSLTVSPTAAPASGTVTGLVGNIGTGAADTAWTTNGTGTGLPNCRITIGSYVRLHRTDAGLRNCS